MRRVLKHFICLVLGMAFAGHVSGFSLWGPLESWQTQNLDYVFRYLPSIPLPNPTLYGEAQGLSVPQNVELGGTKNISQGARLNVPTITYAYDSTFLNYFGAQGVAAVDSAFTVLNGLPSASSANLSAFVTQGNQQVNYSAEAMRMLDLKSVVLWLMMEHMGLIGETHTYDLEERVKVPGTTDPCAFYLEVIQRNFDPVTYNPSSYVNGTLLTYQIGCLDPEQDVGDAMEESVQVGVPTLSAVATREALQLGGYYLRITRDDMGGLRYLYRKSRYINEGFDAETTIGASIGPSYNPLGGFATNAALGGTFAALVGGVEKIRFVKTAYDSELGDTFAPITYSYTMSSLTNGAAQTLTVVRTITAPDIIFTAGDLSFPTPAPYQQTVDRIGAGGINFITYGEAASPGLINTPNAITPAVISPELIVTFNNSGLVYYNIGTAFSDQTDAVDLGFIWGSFNGSTNAPIPFPTGTSINEIENEVLSAGPETSQVGVYDPLEEITTSTTTP